MYARCPPQRIGAAEFADRIPHVFGYAGSAQTDAPRPRAAQDDELLSKDEDLPARGQVGEATFDNQRQDDVAQQ
jgi:hypothetical protein